MQGRYPQYLNNAEWGTYDLRNDGAEQNYLTSSGSVDTVWAVLKDKLDEHKLATQNKPPSVTAVAMTCTTPTNPTVVSCPTGEQPNSAKTACEACGAGTYGSSVDLQACKQCAKGKVPNLEKTKCITDTILPVILLLLLSRSTGGVPGSAPYWPTMLVAHCSSLY